MTFRRTDERGQATVEFVLCLPIAALVLGILFEIGLLVGDHVRLWHAARESARIAIVDSDPEEIRSAAERGGLAPLEVEVDPEFADRSTGRPLTVTLSYEPSGRLPLIGDLISGRAMTSSATMRIEQP
ncbi:MAG TPA: TadE family protein [Actinomycetota bacterium]|nr:TadE family protein [Actinomycetota bacterium]